MLSDADQQAIQMFKTVSMDQWGVGKVKTSWDEDGSVTHRYEGPPYCVATFDWCSDAFVEYEPEIDSVHNLTEEISLRVLARDHSRQLVLMRLDNA